MGILQVLRLEFRKFRILEILNFLPCYDHSYLFQVLNATGDQDICYYNFACAHPLGRVSSFNNIFSNCGYVMLGVLFLILVARRYSKTCVKGPLKNRQNKTFNDKWYLNEGQKYCRMLHLEHSAILMTCIKR